MLDASRMRPAARRPDPTDCESPPLTLRSLILPWLHFVGSDPIRIPVCSLRSRRHPAGNDGLRRCWTHQTKA